MWHMPEVDTGVFLNCFAYYILWQALSIHPEVADPLSLAAGFIGRVLQPSLLGFMWVLGI